MNLTKSVEQKEDVWRGSISRPFATTARVKATLSNEERKGAMRRFFALAQSEGLDCKDSERMREALGFYLHRPVYSRADLSSGQWAECEAALWVGLLAW